MSTYIKSVSATDGFLENCPVEFDRRLTCIIGARGTCKSTLIESIRFVFDSDQKTIETLIGHGEHKGEPRYGLIKSTLGAGSVRCEITSKTASEDSVLVLEREIEAETRIYQEGVREHSNTEILHNIEIFSQGDLQRIAEEGNNELRLILIDRPNSSRIKQIKSERQINSDELLVIGSQLRKLRDEISTLRQELQPAFELREQLKKAEISCPELSPELEASRVLFEKRNRVIEALSNALNIRAEANSRLQQIQYFIEQLNSAVGLIEKESQPEAINALNVLRNMESDLRDVATAANKFKSYNLETSINELKKIFDEKNEIFYRLRQSQQEINESLKKQQLLRRQIEHMEKLNKDLENAKNKETEFLKTREKLRTVISELDNQIYNLRIKEVEEINKQHGSKVFLTLQSDHGSSSYAAKLSAMLSGSRIRTQEEVARALVETFPPAKLIDIVESGNGQLFADVLNRDLGQMNRVVAHLSDNSDLYNLEAMAPAMRLDITMYDKGKPKPVEELSKGQKATALLPLILRPLPYPLLFDQPEDDLDNHFIIESLVNEVKKLKEKRQLIFITHNANIPVLGEADKVIVMSMKNPIEAAPAEFGSIDERKEEILKLLEGGIEAFKMRAMKYRDILDR